LELILVLENADEVIEKIIRKMKSIGGHVKCNRESAIIKKIKKSDDEEFIKMLNNIEELEESSSNNGELMKAYKKVVEYYSEGGNNKYMVYLDKIHKLIKSEEQSKE